MVSAAGGCSCIRLQIPASLQDSLAGSPPPRLEAIRPKPGNGTAAHFHQNWTPRESFGFRGVVLYNQGVAVRPEYAHLYTHWMMRRDGVMLGTVHLYEMRCLEVIMARKSGGATLRSASTGYFFLPPDLLFLV
jgi:hypothetical protein